jgi:hypothetical protein
MYLWICGIDVQQVITFDVEGISTKVVRQTFQKICELSFHEELWQVVHLLTLVMPYLLKSLFNFFFLVDRA